MPLEAVHERLRIACGSRPDIACYEVIGRSEGGREIVGITLGHGEKVVSVIAGSHADEPVGTQTILWIVESVAAASSRRTLNGVKYVIVPHVNPDGEAANRPWVECWPDVLSYIEHAVREPPGRDVEFGYPDMRIENEVVAAWLRRHAPFDLHISLHGMAFAEGGMLLIDRQWIDRTAELRRFYEADLFRAGIGLHDHDRAGDKGFEYIGPGFWTTPRGEAMRGHFCATGDTDTASLFHASSMEFVRSFGGDPLCLVTEIPLFLLKQSPSHQSGVPEMYFRFRATLPEIQGALARNDIAAAQRLIRSFEPEPVDVQTAMSLQYAAIRLGIAAVGGRGLNS